jgi:hypothetical protein
MRSRSLSLSVWRAEFILGAQIGGPDRADDLPRIRIDGIWMRAEMDALLAVAAAVPPPLAADMGSKWRRRRRHGLVRHLLG